MGTFQQFERRLRVRCSYFVSGWVALCILAIVLIGCSGGRESTPLVQLQGAEPAGELTVVVDDDENLASTPADGDSMAAVPTPTVALSPTPTVAPSATPAPDDHGRNISTATEINVGETITGEISDYEDVDYFKFSTDAQKGYAVYVEGAQRVQLLDWRGTFLARDEGEGIIWLAWEGEERYVSVDLGEGGYTISVSEIEYEDLHGDHHRWATAMNLGETMDGIIGTHWDDDFFSFEAVEGELYTIAISLESLRDSQITIVSHGGRELAENDNYADTLASRLEWRAGRSGEHFVKVEAGNYRTDALGSYSLTVDVSSYQDDHGDDFGTASQIGLGMRVEGLLGTDSDVDYFWFEAEKGETYYLDMVRQTLQSGWLIVYDFAEKEPKGLEMTWTDTGRLIWTADRTGKRFFAVTPDRGSWTGSYSVAVSLSDHEDDHADDVTDETIETLVASLQGYLGSIDDVDYFKFEAIKDEYYLINLDYECPIYFPGNSYRLIHEYVCDPTDMRLTLYASDGTTLKYQDSWRYDFNISMKWIAIDDGEFYVGVSRNPEERALFANPYAIGVEVPLERDHDTDEQESAAEIAIDETIDAEIGANRDVDFFKFMAEAGKTYFVYLDLSGIDYINAAVYDFNDQELLWETRCRPEEDEVLMIDAVESGYHYIMLWGYDIDEYCWIAQGSYSIRLEELD